jgi:hypothetical protein
LKLIENQLDIHQQITHQMFDDEQGKRKVCAKFTAHIFTEECIWP